MNAFDFPQPAPTPATGLRAPLVDVHLAGCDCPLCEANAPEPALLSTSANRVALHVIAGLAIGEALVFAIDRLTAGPGLLQQFGW